jgi:hypothetical protein
MRKRYSLPKQQKEAVAKFLAHVDEITEMPAGVHALAATQVVKGKVTLLLSPKWEEYSEAVQREILAHEAGHVALRHPERMLPLITEGLEIVVEDNAFTGKAKDMMKAKQRMQVANAVIDCSLHHNNICDWEFVDRELGWKSNTFERMELPPLPPEMAFHLAMQKQQDPLNSCGSLEVSFVDDSDESFEASMSMAIEVGTLLTAGRTRANRRPLTETLPPVPKWITKVIDELLQKRGRLFRKRSWRRENRFEHPLLPGMGPRTSLDAIIMSDASGSVYGSPAYFQFLAAITATPELKGTEVIAFDTTESDPVPASNTAAVIAAHQERGGGTMIRKAGKCRVSGRPVVWLTDADSSDGLPEPHDATELWVLCAGDRKVPGKKIVI